MRRRFAIVGHESINRVIRTILREGHMLDAVHDHQEHSEVVEFNMADDSERVHRI